MRPGHLTSQDRTVAIRLPFWRLAQTKPTPNTKTPYPVITMTKTRTHLLGNRIRLYEFRVKEKGATTEW